MKLRITKKEGGLMEMAIGGEGHTLLNLLQSSLLRNEDVKMAGYSKPHPLMNRSVFYMEVKQDKHPEKTLLEAIEDAKNIVNEFLTDFEKQIEDFKKTS